MEEVSHRLLSRQADGQTGRVDKALVERKQEPAPSPQTQGRAERNCRDWHRSHARQHHGNPFGPSDPPPSASIIVNRIPIVSRIWRKDSSIHNIPPHMANIG